jgi:hypothetical protein
MMRFIIATLAFIGFATPLYANPVDDLDFYTEQYPPYNMMMSGEKQSISIAILREVLDVAETRKGIPDVEVVPWARGYKTALNTPNTVLFSTTRTTSREDKFNHRFEPCRCDADRHRHSGVRPADPPRRRDDCQWYRDPDEGFSTRPITTPRFGQALP